MPPIRPLPPPLTLAARDALGAIFAPPARTTPDATPATRLDGDAFTRAPSGPSTSASHGAIAPALIPRAPWTFFTYIAADNNLAPYAAEDLAEMARAGSSASLNVIALVDTPAGASLQFVEKGRERRIDVDPLSTLGHMLAARTVNTGDPALLRAAVEYVQREVPSSKFFLNLWNHGDAWRGIAFDDGHRDFIHIAGGELVSALRGLRVDVLGADACTIATAEVASIARALGAKVLVASADNEPGSGWSYADVVDRVSRVLERGGDELAVSRSVVESYGAGPLANTTLSATDLRAFDDVAAAISKLSQALVRGGGLQNADIRACYLSVRRLGTVDAHAQMDLTAFALALWDAFPMGPIVEAARDVLAALNGASVGRGSARDTGHLSIYAPTSSVAASYDGPLASWHALGWSSFLRTMSAPSLAGTRVPTWAIAAQRRFPHSERDALAAFARSAYSHADAERAREVFSFLSAHEDARRYIGHKILNGNTDVLDAAGITTNDYDDHELADVFRHRGFGVAEIAKARAAFAFLGGATDVEVARYVGLKIVAGNERMLVDAGIL